MIKATFASSKLANENKNIAEIIATESPNSFAERKPNSQKTISVGFGKIKDCNRRKFRINIRKIVSLAKQNKVRKIALNLETLGKFAGQTKNPELAEIIASELEFANYEFVAYKTKPKEGWDFIEEIIIAGKIAPDMKLGWKRGQIVGDEVNACRTLANTPGGDMTPPLLASAAHLAAKDFNIKITILNEAAIARLKMGGILGVSKGSAEPPRFIIMEYFGAGEKSKPTVLIGKGVTFDTGGLSLKPADAMTDMHMDMSGGAAVIHAIVAVAKLGVKKNIIGLIPSVENNPSGTSFRPGDILKSMSGKTIEVLSTDAEGRIILADAIHYAKKYRPELVIDVATLTGAAMVALGQHASALFCKDNALAEKIARAGEASGDYIWRMPLWDEYDEEIKGIFGDVANIGKTRYGGAITAAAFLKQFAGEMPWAHIDIAPRMTSIEGEYLAKGATGAPVRLFVEFLKNQK